MQYRPYLYVYGKPAPDGEAYCLRQLAAKDTLAEAVEVVRAELSKPVAAEVCERVTFMGVGLTQEQADKFADGIRRRIER